MTWGTCSKAAFEREVLFTLLADRYEAGRVLITSHLPFSQWEGIFKDPMTSAAAIDRLVHPSVIRELNGPSYRMAHAKAADRAGGRAPRVPPGGRADVGCGCRSRRGERGRGAAPGR